MNSLDEARSRFGVHEAGPAQLVRAAYRAVGPRLGLELRGRFVAIVYDALNDEMVAVRDRVGFVPLFHRRTSAGLELAGIRVAGPHGKYLTPFLPRHQRSQMAC